MRHGREILLWLVATLVGLGLLVWALPSFFPLLPSGLQIDRQSVKTLALEKLRELGELPEDAYVVTLLRSDPRLERRLQLALAENEADTLTTTTLARQQLSWEVTVYPPGAGPFDWSHEAWIGLDGEILGARRRDRETGTGNTSAAAQPAPVADSEELARRAREYLTSQGIDLNAFEDEVRVQSGDRGALRETAIRLREKERPLGENFVNGLEVFFENGELRGYNPYFDDPRQDELQEAFREVQLSAMLRTVLVFILLPLVAVPFLRLYHEGLIGVRLGLRLFLLGAGSGLIYLFLHSDLLSAGTNLGFTSRQQTTWLIGTFIFVFQHLGLATLALMAWSVGEVFCRRHWPQKLASFDALLTFRWQSSTLARSLWRGHAGGILMAGILAAGAVFLQRFGAFPLHPSVFDATVAGPIPGFARLLEQVVGEVPYLLFACLLVPAFTFGRWGAKTGFVLSSLCFLVIVGIPFLMPVVWGSALWIPVAALPALLFYRGDVLSAMVAPATATVLLFNSPLFLTSATPRFQVFGWLSLIVFFLPFLLSLRHLLADTELTYHYDDVPPHVRRIAERERLRVELETARGIQSAILPDLPPAVNGIELAHTYLPATEVGGDFYDVLALEDGRVAVAIGDVAGHGVSSGLVMSMAKSALAVQVTFDPEVLPVFATLNRMVFQSARRRLLSTLCYALVDPRSGHMAFASAGHVFPYRVSPGGEVEALESIAYPLGVRKALEIQLRSHQLGPGDAVFLFSDGLVEASREGDEEPFGFERLERSLAQHAGKSASRLRDAVIADVRAFTRYAPQTDDLTVLVLKLPFAA